MKTLLLVIAWIGFIGCGIIVAWGICMRLWWRMTVSDNEDFIAVVMRNKYIPNSDFVIPSILFIMCAFYIWK